MLSSKSVQKVLFFAALSLMLCAQVNSRALHSIGSFAKTLIEKAADVADKTEPVERKGGVRATILHQGADMVLEKGLDVLGNKFPAIKLAAPVVCKWAMPAMNSIHQKINDWHERSKKNVTTTTTTTTSTTTTTPAPVKAESQKDDKPKETDDKAQETDGKNDVAEKEGKEQGDKEKETNKKKKQKNKNKNKNKKEEKKVERKGLKKSLEEDDNQSEEGLVESEPVKENKKDSKGKKDEKGTVVKKSKGSEETEFEKEEQPEQENDKWSENKEAQKPGALDKKKENKVKEDGSDW